MPSFKPKDLWIAEPHTLAKIEIVQRYLYLWFSILGRSHETLLYIDGFAGPGRYKNSDQSSPLAALKAGCDAIQKAEPLLKTKRFFFRFIETDFAEDLRKVINFRTWPAEFNLKVEENSFEKYMDTALEKVRKSDRELPPTFAFVDPFGATGVPFRVISQLLSYPRCELLLNLDSDGIGRLLTAQQFKKNQEHLTSIFGDNSWKTELDPCLPMSRLSAQVLALYKRRLRSVVSVRYIFAFAMNSKQGQLN